MILPLSTMSGALESRQTYCSNSSLGSDGRCQTSGWYYYGRWVLAAIVIIFFIILFFTWSCITNRRRRRAGLNPRYGTGWMAPGPGGYNNNGQQPQYANNNNNNHHGGGWFGYGGNKHNNQQPPPPQYTPGPGPYAAPPPQGQQYTGQTFNSNEGYYGQHQNDIPLQQPTGSYYPRGGDNVYEPPSGPPPAKS